MFGSIHDNKKKHEAIYCATSAQKIKFDSQYNSPTYCVIQEKNSNLTAEFICIM